jgi:predicted membrane-bound spermidine synthase
MPKSYWWAYVVVFIASGCALVLELVAGRIVAPVVGVSLYTWTSVIGVVLAGISLGNYAGGVVADRFVARRTLGVILALGGLSSLIVLPLTRVMPD